MIVGNVLVKQAIFHETVNEAYTRRCEISILSIVSYPHPCFLFFLYQDSFFFSSSLFFQETRIFDTIKYLFSNGRWKNGCLDSEMQVWDSLEPRLSKFSKNTSDRVILISSLPLRMYKITYIDEMKSINFCRHLPSTKDKDF